MIEDGTLEITPPSSIASGHARRPAVAKSQGVTTNLRVLGSPHPPSQADGHDRDAGDVFEGGPLDHGLPSRLAARPIGFHVILRLEDDRTIATTTHELRVLARVVLEQGERRGLLAFGAADNHLHAELATSRDGAGAFAHDVATSLRWRLGLGVRFERARIRQLVDQRHAYNTFHYVLRQDDRHAIGRDHAREGTCLPDLLGLRVGHTTIAGRVRAHLPRVNRAALLAHFPAAALTAKAAPLPSLDLLKAGACAAFALPHLGGRAADAHRARQAIVHAAPPTARNKDLSDLLGVGIRAIQTLRSLPTDTAAVRAVVSQARLRAPFDTERA